MFSSRMASMSSMSRGLSSTSFSELERTRGKMNAMDRRCKSMTMAVCHRRVGTDEFVMVQGGFWIFILDFALILDSVDGQTETKRPKMAGRWKIPLQSNMAGRDRRSR